MKKKKTCDVCGTSERVYKNAKHQLNLCRAHAYMLNRYGEIREEEKACEVCGKTYHAFYRKEFGKILCRRHDDHMRKYGKIMDTLPEYNKILIRGNVAEVILCDRYGKETSRALIDEEDVEKVREIQWKDGKVAVRGKVNEKNVSLHRYITECSPDMIIHHINGDYLDNRKENLKIVTRKERNLMRKKTALNSSGYTGVRWVEEKKKWSASVTIDGKLTFLGHYENMEEAIISRLKGEKEYYGECAPQKHLFHQFGIE